MIAVATKQVKNSKKSRAAVRGRFPPIEKPIISVIVPVYNTEKYLAECLDSVLCQTFKDFEVIAIDDGSTDKSPEILKKYVAKDKRIKIITQKNYGVVTARNNAISKARGEYIFPLDSDDMITPDCLELLYNFAVSNPKYAVVAPEVLRIGESQGIFIKPAPTAWNMSIDNCIVNASLFKKAFWEKYGGYDTTFNDGLEDYDFWMNFINDGHKIIRLPQVLFYYRMKNCEESRNFKYMYTHKNLMKMLYRKYPSMHRNYNLQKILKFIYRKIYRRSGRITIKIFKITIFRYRNKIILPGADKAKNE